MSFGDERNGYRCLETILSSSSNYGDNVHSYSETSHSSSINCGGYHSSDLLEVGPGHKRPATLTLNIGEQELMLKVEVDICLIPDTLPPITQMTVTDCLLHQYLLVI